MLGACSDQGWEYLHAWSREGGVLLMLGASTGQGVEYLHAWSREVWILLMLGVRASGHRKQFGV